MKRVRSLLRLSSKKQVVRHSDEQDIPGQRAAIARYLETKPDWILEGEYVEPGVSAYKKGRKDRDKLNDAINDAENGKYDLLIVWKGDRLSRRIEDFPGIVRELTEDYGVEVWSVADAQGGKQWTARSALEMLMLSIEGFKNQSESENISIRTKEAKRQMRENGQWNGAPTPFGYQLVALKDANGEPALRGGKLVRTLIPDPVTAPVVREMFRRYISGDGTVQITRWLNTSGTPSKSGRQWYRMTVRQILMNSFYAGYLSSRVITAETKGSHEPIIDEATWRMAQGVSEMRANIPRRQLSADYVFTGVIFCGECGKRVGGMPSTRTHKGLTERWYNYRCRSRHGVKCGLPSRTAEKVERSFLDALKDAVQPTALGDYLKERYDRSHKEIEDHHAARRSAEDRLRQIESVLMKLNTAFLEGGTYTKEEFVSLKGKYTLEKETLAGILARPAPEVTAVDYSTFADASRQLVENWNFLTQQEKKQAVIDFCNMCGVVLVLHKDGHVSLRDTNES